MSRSSSGSKKERRRRTFASPAVSDGLAPEDMSMRAHAEEIVPFPERFMRAGKVADAGTT